VIVSRDFELAKRIRAAAEAAEMYFEGQLALPKNEAELDRFELDVRLAREAGATVVSHRLPERRRYESFDSAKAFALFRERSLGVPGDGRTGAETPSECVLAIENHKDWFAADLIELLRKFRANSSARAWISQQSCLAGRSVGSGHGVAHLRSPLTSKTWRCRNMTRAFGYRSSIRRRFSRPEPIIGVWRRANSAIRCEPWKMITARSAQNSRCLTGVLGPMGEVGVTAGGYVKAG